MMLFHEDINYPRDRWKDSSARRFIDSRGEKLIHDLLCPRAGERLLDIGCGTSEHLLFFRKQGCRVTGLETSSAGVEATGKILGHQGEIHEGQAEDLPFSDNEFDIVTLISALEFAVDPKKAISEAVRVSRDRVFIGTWNKYAIINSYGGGKGVSCSTAGNRPVHLWGGYRLVRWIRNLLPNVPIQWGSIIFFPLGWYPLMAGLELHIPTSKNPFGAFLGLSFPVHPSFQTIQDVIREPLGVNAKSGQQPLQGVARGMKK